MSHWGTVIYAYDGSFDGLLSCVFESFNRHELPPDILPEDETISLLFPVRSIPTDPDKAERVMASIPQKLGGRALELIQTGFLFCGKGKEMAILRFLRLAFRVGPKAVDLFGDKDVSALLHMERAVLNDRHLQLEFLRFAEHRGCLISIIEPKHLILPMLREHFCSRFPEEHLLIWDKAHGMALLYRPYEAQLVDADELDLSAVEDTELDYQLLWKHYYDSIAIQQRINPKCRMTHMPKRFWPHMLELNGEPLRLDTRRLKAGENCPPSLQR